jgi:hypothetical protein
MSNLSEALRDMGFMPTGEESPIDEDAELWSNGHELVCDRTGTVIDGNHHVDQETDDEDVERHNGKIIYRYRKSEKVKLPGGYTGSYDWGDDGDTFRY